MRVLVIALALFAQTAAPPATSFRARLSPVPVESANASKITGTGTVTATLNGSTLTIAGTFEGMKSAATIAQVHMGQRGVRGPVEFDLQIDKSPGGSIKGTITLTKVQMDTLRKGWYYVQVHAEQAPDGNLWGWLLPTTS
jgi:CHRD domain-containing protein